MSKWISVNDRKPEDAERVFVGYKGYVVMSQYVDNTFMTIDLAHEWDDVHFWMPIDYPAPPTSVKLG